MTYFFLFSAAVLSADCPELPAGEAIRLDQPGGSLENYRHQDQDGLGICYATAAATILQTVLPTHPEMSYLQMAVMEGTKDVEGKLKEDPNLTDLFVKKNPPKQKADGETSTDNKYTFAMTSGAVCRTVEYIQEQQLKKNGPVLCPKNKTNFEDIIADNGDPNFVSLKTFLESSKYMNLYYDTFSAPQSQKSSEEFSKAFTEFIAEKKNKLKKNECKHINGNGIESILHDMLPIALTYKDCFTPNSAQSNEYTCKMIRTIAPDATKKNEYVMTAKEIGQPLLSKIKDVLEKPGKNFSATQMKKDFKNTLIAESKIAKNDLTSANKLADELIDEISDEKIDDLVAEFNEIKSKKSSAKCVERFLMDYITKSKFEDDWGKVQVLCENSLLMKQAATVSVEYEKSGLKDVNNVLQFLQRSAGLSYHDAMMSLYATDCKEKDKVSIPDKLKLKCTYYPIAPNNKTWLDSKLLENLKANKAISIGFCSQILVEPKKQWPPGECGQHAVNVTGIRCVAGKYQYLIQNSWGLDYVASNPDIRTEEDKDAHWFDEQSFYDSVYNITTLDLEK